MSPEASFAEDLDADPSDLAGLIMVVTEEFSSTGMKLEICDGNAKRIQTVKHAIDYLCDLRIEED